MPCHCLSVLCIYVFWRKGGGDILNKPPRRFIEREHLIMRCTNVTRREMSVDWNHGVRYEHLESGGKGWLYVFVNRISVWATVVFSTLFTPNTRARMFRAHIHM